MNSDTRKSISGGVEWAKPEPGSSPSDKPFFTIGELAQEFGLTFRALRFYEDKGLLAPQRRGVTRLYTPQDRARVGLIVKGKNLGFTLTEISNLVAAEERGSAVNGSDIAGLNLSKEKCLEQINTLEKQKTQIESALTELHKHYATLTEKDMSGGAATP